MLRNGVPMLQWVNHDRNILTESIYTDIIHSGQNSQLATILAVTNGSLGKLMVFAQPDGVMWRKLHADKTPWQHFTH